MVVNDLGTAEGDSKLTYGVSRERRARPLARLTVLKLDPDRLSRFACNQEHEYCQLWRDMRRDVRILLVGEGELLAPPHLGEVEKSLIGS